MTYNPNPIYPNGSRFQIIKSTLEQNRNATYSQISDALGKAGYGKTIASPEVSHAKDLLGIPRRQPYSRKATNRTTSESKIRYEIPANKKYEEYNTALSMLVEAMKKIDMAFTHIDLNTDTGQYTASYPKEEIACVTDSITF